jgi:hypothetical protein
MSIDGTWKVTIESPMGPMASTLILASADGAVTGTQSGQDETQTISEGKIEGNNIFWANNVSKPIAMKIEFSGVVDGSQMSGKAKAGFFGSFPFTGVKE